MSDPTSLAVRLAIAIALPSVACIGYYGLDDLRPEYSAWAVPVVLAYPLLLIGVAGGVMQWAAPQRRSKWLLGLSAASIVLPALLLWLVHA
jgi:hypothetical protein